MSLQNDGTPELPRDANGAITPAVYDQAAGVWRALRGNSDGTLEVTATTGNAQIGGSDVSNSNPMPVSDAGGSLTVDGTVTASIADGGNVSLGAKADTVASNDTGTFSLIALFKRLLAKLPGLGQTTSANSMSVTIASDQSSITTAASISGPLGRRSDATSLSAALSTEDAALLAAAATPATQAISATSLPLPTGAATSALQGGGLPAALGTQAIATSLGVGLSTEDIARVGIVTETAPATDTASSGLNGRLQRIAQRITSLIALIPTALDTGAFKTSLYGKSTNAGDTPLLLTSAGYLKSTQVRSSDGLEVNFGNGASDGLTTQSAAYVLNYNHRFNGTTWDREYNNFPITVGASAARTSTLTGSNQTAFNARSLLVFVNVTARAVATTLTVSVQVQDPVSTNFFTIWTATVPINSSSGLFAYELATGTPSAASWTEAVSTNISRNFRVVVTPSDANSVTYSAAGMVLV